MYKSSNFTNLLRFYVKSYRTDVKIFKILILYLFIFFKKKTEKNCNDGGVGQDLTEFAKISSHECL
jgi:hypothetical protein